MNLKTLVVGVRDRLGDRGIRASVIESAAKRGGLERFAEAMAGSEHFKDLQRTDPLALDGSLVATLPADFLSGFISRVSHAGVGNPFVIVDSREDLDYFFNGEFGAAAVENGKLYCRAPDDVVLAGDVNVTGVFIPTLASVPAKREGLLVEIVSQIVQTGATP